MILTCASCRKRNRVTASHLFGTVRCGSCKTVLTPVTEPIDVDAAAFDEIVGGVHVPILIDFWAAWCGPCRSAAPEVRAVAQQAAGRALVLKVDTEAHPELAARFDVRAIPNLVVLRNGHTVFQRAGVASRGEMKTWLDKAEADT